MAATAAFREGASSPVNRASHASTSTDERHAYLSSSLVRELIRLGGSVKGFVPKVVEKEIRRKTQGYR
jgi:hypothetical protein